MKLSDNTLVGPEFDCVSFQGDSILAWNDEQVSAYQEKFIIEAFRHHYSNSEEYRKFCENSNIGLDDIKIKADLVKIPQIPSAIFKSIDVLSIDRKDIVKRCTSSGTHGLISNIYRDEITLDRLLNSISFGLKELYDIDINGCTVVNLGPDTDEAADIWFAYITSILNLVLDAHNFMVKGELQCEAVYNFINNNSDKKLLILGAPPLLLHFINYLKDNGLKLNLKKGDIVKTAGGWKKHTGIMIERDEFSLLMKEYFNADEEGILDAFNQVELNTVVFECNKKSKHLPPWVKVIVRDPYTLEDIGYEKLGILSYLDASSNSYPCFLLSDDLGILKKDCSCGRSGDVVQLVRRVKKVEAKGCAIKIDSNLLRRVK